MQTLLIVAIAVILMLAAASHAGQPTASVNYSKADDLEKTAPDNFAGNTVDKKVEKRNASLAMIAEEVLKNHFAGKDKRKLSRMSVEYQIPENYKQSRGLFVTFYKNGKTRACWGSVEPIHENLVKAVIYTAEDALAKEYRHEPISKDEIDSIDVQVTVINEINSIHSYRELNPLHDGLMVRGSGKGAVILPGEASDPHYQIVMARSKAGLQANQPCQLYRLSTDVYR